MEGLEVSIISKENLDLGDRIDAEYFQRYNLLIEQRLKELPHQTLGEIATFVASAFYPAATQLYAVGDTPFIRCVDCIDYPLITKEQDESFEKIPKDFIKDNIGVNILNKNDIVITKVGSPCYASIVYEHDVVALSRTVMGLKNITGVNPLYLLTFLRSKYGFQELYREREQTIQFQLTLERVRKISIYIANSLLQDAIADVYHRYYANMRNADQLYKQVEQILLDELCFNQIMETEVIYSHNKFSEFVNSGRLDAKYYQPKYNDLFSRLSKFETKRLGDIVQIRKSIEPGSEAYQNKGSIPFIRVSNLSKFGFSDTEIHLSPDEYGNVIRPKQNTILLSKDGSVGIAYKVEQDMNVITSGAILHLTITDNEFMPDYLTLVLNSVIVGMQAERDAGGSIIQHWKPSEIENVIIPKLSQEIQQEITNKVKESFALRRESKRLLNLAKTAVETAIEQGENAALRLLDKSS